jgi:hypothetical protein
MGLTLNRQQVLEIAERELPHRVSILKLNTEQTTELVEWALAVMGPRMVSVVSGGWGTEEACYALHRGGNWLSVGEDLWLRHLAHYTYIKVTWG